LGGIGGTGGISGCCGTYVGGTIGEGLGIPGPFKGLLGKLNVGGVDLGGRYGAVGNGMVGGGAIFGVDEIME
jgi:hypothetical protein